MTDVLNTMVPDAEATAPAVLSVQGLTVGIGPRKAPKPIVTGISLDLVPGRIHGLAGESGSGKTVSSLAILGLLPANATVGGSITLFDADSNGAGPGGTELIGMRRRALNRIRGRRIAMIFQDPSSSLHPQLTVGSQLTDHVRTHLKLGREAARDRAIELLTRVRVPNPVEALGRYPHQFSGGQRQRIAIAIALACDPVVLLADEPTTALDVTVQAGILHLLRDLADERQLAVLLVTHDLGVMSAIADEVSVMRHGVIVETGPREQIFGAPQHAYTRELLESLPSAQGADTPSAIQKEAGR
ncbi:ABC transporter ATP-binding protein [Microterricola pindariensis]|uniref:Dipeptide/oligopeptide/nickel ABC transporter ATP-binding protein n=1 Tax=Microterricola pindariensis TaxID=478010 RepID=A0ABX5ASG6_9MICO|nr:ABC transporter ATP-binding protein [Microterricola pindariensis]PPL14709.1 dipeptide/oligopeptide/nickel ABC transporter ATP-binding protein [Microterricola pindariensis]